MKPCLLVLATLIGVLCGCNRAPSTTEAATPSIPTTGSGLTTKGEIRLTGSIQAVNSVKVLVPQIQGQYSNMTLTQLIANGSKVAEGDLIATFDPAQQIDAAREAQQKFEDLGNQAEQKAAENRTNAEKRLVDLKSAEGELTKAQLELQKGPVLSEIDRGINEAKAAGAKTRLASLKESMAARERSEVAALKILELQRDRQKIAIQRAQDNIKKLEVHAPISGMVAHELTRRANTYGKAQAGDVIYRGYPLLSIFDPKEMKVVCQVNEPDILAVHPGTPATVVLDAYPDKVFPAKLLSASPVAASALDGPLKAFTVVFEINGADPLLLPDLSAAVVVKLGGEK